MTLSLGGLGLGCAQLGNLYREVDDATAAEIVAAAWDAGVRYFDTAPHYGLGLSERRLGAAVRGFPRAKFVLSTKVGRRLEPDPEGAGRRDSEGFAVPADIWVCGAACEDPTADIWGCGWKLGGGGGRYFTGSPADGYGCSVCHTSKTPYSFPVVQYGVPMNGYVPGKAYQIRLTWPEATSQSAIATSIGRSPKTGLNAELVAEDGGNAGRLQLPSATLSAEALTTLQQAIEAARSGRQSKINIVGHTDTSGSADYNEALSVRRANVVKDVLVQMGARRW